MTQLVLDVEGAAVILPESIKGAYKAYEEDLGKELVMVPGNMVKEIRGAVWRVEYQYGYFTDEEKDRVIAACRKGRRQPISCTFLPPEGSEMITADFFVTSFTPPKFMWSREAGESAVPLWADFALELREVEPHD